MNTTPFDPKGKRKATDQQFEDLKPTITFRHILSQGYSVKNPLRVVALCDGDAFYAGCERVRLGTDPSVPLAVVQWGMLIAVNYPARKFGISRMDKIKDAMKRCPELVAVHVPTIREGDQEPKYWDKPDTRTHKVSLDYYRQESMKIINMFKESLPTGEVEKASIDEAFIDFTEPVRVMILERYPYLAQVPPDAPDGPDTPLPPPPPILWSGLGNVIPIHPAQATPDSSSTTAPPNADESHSDAKNDGAEDDSHTTWHDVALSIAAELMGKIRDDIWNKLGYSMSAGLARNKFLAKLAASYKKPNNQSILRNDAIPNYLRPFPFQKIRNLGGKLGYALAKEYDVLTVGDLLSVSLDEMLQKFGESAVWVYEIMHGIDRSEVIEKSAIMKSMIASKSLIKPILKPSEGPNWIRILATELAHRLKDARESAPGLWPKTIALHIRQAHETSRSRQATFPFSKAVTIDLIAAAADKLWRELVGTDATHRGPMKVTGMGLSFSGIEAMELGQKNIDGFFSSGEGCESGAKRKRGVSLPATLTDLGSDGSKSDATDTALGLVSFTCERCRKIIHSSPRANPALDIDEARRHALEMLRLEHDDFHFAQDLSRSPGSQPPPKKKKKKEKPKEPEGIAKFFIKKG